MCRYLPATFVQTASETEIGVMQWDLPSTGFNTGWYQDIYNSLLELNREVHHCKKSASRKLSWISLFPVKAGIIGEWKSYPIPIPGCSNHNMRSLTVLLPPWCVCVVCVFSLVNVMASSVLLPELNMYCQNRIGRSYRLRMSINGCGRRKSAIC